MVEHGIGFEIPKVVATNIDYAMIMFAGVAPALEGMIPTYYLIEGFGDENSGEWQEQWAIMSSELATGSETGAKNDINTTYIWGDSISNQPEEDDGLYQPLQGDNESVAR